MAHLGIDLGTSNTLVALVSPAGLPVLEEIDNERMVPSVVYIEGEGGNPVVGRAALDMWADPAYEPSRCFRRWKLAVGTGAQLARLDVGPGADPLRVTPELLTTRLVEYVVGQLHGLGGSEIESVLVSVPHGWRRDAPEKVYATRRAAEGARVGGRAVPVQRRTISEPVAAAAYWVWSARQGGGTGMGGETLLVCDVGGGTLDLSLVRVGAGDEPLDVVAAVHDDAAGDYADALLCAWVGRQLPAAERAAVPATAEGVLEALAAGRPAWLRRWFVRAGQLKQDLSLRAERARGPVQGVKPVRAEFAAGGAAHTVALGVAEMEEVLEPFYRRGRELLAAFLAGRPADEVPHAVAFAGGGSRIRGVRQRMVEPALAALYGADRAAAALGRLHTAEGRLDQAIALGAALVANGVVRVTERLLHDVGIEALVPVPVARALNLPADDTPVVLTPVLARGSALPARAASGALGLATTAEPGERLRLRLVVDDREHGAWTQSWELARPGGVSQGSLDWELEADADGFLTFRLATPAGERTEVEGTLQRAPAEAGGGAGVAETLDVPPLLRVAPAELRRALDAVTPADD